ncbi:4-(cytidine 5'-diphospho)-2-C-methyl-D-erythritol kinase [Neptunicoccus cionae]|uniref:4-(cytidine 5'-diphospho)-2-C-methyl-D-erythritol kinase n=1 Tax=Neptunicoccus cionae TaxID=2035344 RepID=UPI000C763859|nr:4-(cytidine 5'-diphospho)-2-C-methyl-D-erythritol kinase [Amylibacter cionae]PLS23118.1 4-(cytidine 5'-diphospho)-2-C-methyl-D-erythritol kinase [Amylibacter cionae]
MVIERVARAKINLCLHVTGQREDGYHLLDSVVAFADYGDVLTFAPAESVSLSISGPFGGGLSGAEDNLILQAARCFKSKTGQGAAVNLEKKLPVASGIGGGSADAAAALAGFSELWGLPLPDPEIQLSLGADVPICVAGQPLRMRGIGEVIEPLQLDREHAIVLVNPDVSVSTPVVFKALKDKNNPPVTDGPDKGWINWLAQQRNDLEAPAIAQSPVIADVLAALEQTSPALCRMSGSGATCFGLYDSVNAAQDAAERLSARHPDWWVQTTRLTT